MSAEGYTIERKLGEGACGAAYLAVRGDGARLALKRIRIAKLSPAERKAVVREVQLLSRLRHPNIIGYEDAFMDGGEMCIVMELADGGTLESQLRSAIAAGERLDESWVLDVVVQLCSCVHHLHACRILHRDIKPANILLSRDATPKLADFGISIPMLTDEATLGRHLPGGSADEDRAPDTLRSKTLEGTPLYLVP